MLQIILLIAGTIWAIRRPKLVALTPAQFPNVTPEVFSEWKAAELASITMLLWASWGVFIVSLVAVFCAGLLAVLIAGPAGATGMETKLTWTIQAVFLIVFIILVVIASNKGKRASQIKQQYGIKWP